MQSVYGVDVRDVWTGRLSWRRLSVLIFHLPHDAALWRELHGEDAPWSTTEHMLASVIDQLAGANWQRAQGKPAQRPKPIPRPDPSRTAKKAETVARLARLGLLTKRG